jgi:hypothetical protein
MWGKMTVARLFNFLSLVLFLSLYFFNFVCLRSFSCAQCCLYLWIAYIADLNDDLLRLTPLAAISQLYHDDQS